MSALNHSAGDVGNTGRTAKLGKFFNAVLRGEQTLKTVHDGNRFIESICAQSDPSTCVEKLISRPQGILAFQMCVRFNSSPAFHNGLATALLQYLQNPPLKMILGGVYLHQIVENIVTPPIFWHAFVQSFRSRVLNLAAQQCFGWLLSELLSLPQDKNVAYLPLAQEDSVQRAFLESESLDLRALGQRIKHLLSTYALPDQEDEGFGPGGRHDNDFADFHDIAIHPTADELLSTEEPFLRRADILEDPNTEDRRLIMHLDTQFRLLREEMLGEMRDELQIIHGKKKGRHRGLIVDGFTVLDVHCGEPKRRQPWGLRFQFQSNLSQLFSCKPKDRKQYLTKNQNLFRHQSLACLMVDEEIVSFPTIYRDVDQLAAQPPVVTLQFTGKTSTIKALLRMGTGKRLKLIQIDTAVFAFEPILRNLQKLREMPLVDELLLWKPGNVVSLVSDAPSKLLHQLKVSHNQDIQSILGTTKSTQLDNSQMQSLLAGLSQSVSLIQGPPGTGKSFIGALIAKGIHMFTKKVILVVCYTNHALDQFLEDLLDIGIPPEVMLRLGGKSTARTKPLTLSEQSATHNMSQAPWKVINGLRTTIDQLATNLHEAFAIYKSARVQQAQVLEYLEFNPDFESFYEAFHVPKAEDGTVRVGPRGKAINESYLLSRWLNGNNAGIFVDQVSNSSEYIWQMHISARQSLMSRWRIDILKEAASELYTIARMYNEAQVQLDRIFKQRDADIIKSRRVIACTTTAAAKYTEELQASSRDVLVVEEAGEILESHIMTALGPKTQQLVLIGDHKQLRPKVNNYSLTVEKGDGYDLNRSLFERLMLKNFPHQTLHKQHRMRPEMSALVRSLTYPDLIDASTTLNRADIRGLQSNLIFVAHEHLEDDAKETANWKDMSSISSKQNRYEVDMVLKLVRYLAQQGYGTEKIVVLTPYLGQLRLLQSVLSQENDPILNDLDSFDLVRAGLLPAASAKLNQRQINLSTIDNYQGEESDIVIASLTRSNPTGDIGFMAAPERLNVLLSRARNGLIMIGNPSTFLEARKGKETWKHLLDLLKRDGHIYDGFPVKCERHPDRKSVLRDVIDFESECPDGGCKEPCGTVLNCGLHSCPQSCHQLYDHSKIQCQYVLNDRCPQGHLKTWKCHKPPTNSCGKCEEDAKRLQQEKQKALKLQEKQAREEKEHLTRMAKLDTLIADERQRVKDMQLSQERARAVQLKERDLERVRVSVLEFSKPSSVSSSQRAAEIPAKPDTHLDPRHSMTVDQAALPSTSAQVAEPVPAPTANRSMKEQSLAKTEWDRQKRMDNVSNDAIDAIMDMVGLEGVKLQVLRIKAKIDISARQNSDLKQDCLNAVFMGNPGTGKTTVARLYADTLTSLGALPGSGFLETTGSRLANDGVPGVKKTLEELHNAGGGALFLDEAYQLAEQHDYGGKQVLDFLLAEMENNVGKIVFILAGYNKEMEKFFEHNPGLVSRVPYKLQFSDYQDDELFWMLQKRIEKRYNNKMVVDGGNDGLYMRIAVRRLGRMRGRPGFGNARALKTLNSIVSERQADRVGRERRDGLNPDDYFLSQEDLIGPDPSKAILKSAAWGKLQKLTGLKSVKEAVKAMVARISVNYQRELLEKEPIQVSLNRVFLGSPGTGKTTVAKLYGQILADLGLLSNGEVSIKNPADFIGSALGQSEKNTQAILATTIGKVLIIDEAYMLSGKTDSRSQPDMYKTAVVDTIVAEVQSVPGEDRCVLLLGYEDEMRAMFQHVNPGLSRRFAIESAFHFDDFTDSELLEILRNKLKQQDLDATDDAKAVAIEVLGRARNRPNFGNAGEVENLLSLGKNRYQARQSSEDVTQQTYHVIFEPQDFDPDFERGKQASTNLQALFADVVGCEEVIDKLRGYQQIALNMKARGRQSRGMIPTNFLFKGPPGTGKTTTARKMGQVFYDLGFLSAVEVVECSASDLIGSYVGHTGPKTRAQLEKALGKVLFVDEAYRLAEGNFATEAMNEMVDLLTKPTFMDKIVVILAGYDKDINNLISVNPGLSSRFPEQIIFQNMSPGQCLQVLSRTIKEQEIDTPDLMDVHSQVHKDMVVLMTQLASLPSWGNARDVKTLAKTITGAVYRRESAATDPLAVPADEILRHTREMLHEREDRVKNMPSNDTNGLVHRLQQQVSAPRSAGPPKINDTNTIETVTLPEKDPEPLVPLEDEEVHRDKGVSDEIWTQLQIDAQAAKAELKISDETVRTTERQHAEAASKAREKVAEVQRWELKKARDEAEAQEIKRKQEEARLEERAAWAAREKAKAELERVRLQEAKQKREKQVQAKLRQMGVCVAGFQWIKQSSGYRCAGGSHFVSNGQLGL